MLKHVNPIFVPSIFSQLVFYKSAWSEETVNALFVRSQPFVNVSLRGKHPPRRCGTRVTAFGHNIPELASMTLLARTPARHHVVTRANQFEIVDVIQDRYVLTFQLPQNRRGKMVIDVSNMRHIRPELPNHSSQFPSCLGRINCMGGLPGLHQQTGARAFEVHGLYEVLI